MTGGALFVAVFVACMVEAVEAATIVLAIGTARHWRSALQGVGVALAVLAVVVAVLGTAIGVIPLGAFRLVVGTVLMVFGLQWLRKAILRASGYKALHDEDAIFRRQLEAARNAGEERRGRVADWYGFTLCFKATLLEGLEVVFIVVTFGNDNHRLPLAIGAAALGVIVVAGVATAVRAPLSRVPENGMKFVVGVMLTAYGAFWGAEGAGAAWPGSDAALLWLMPAIALFALLLIALLRGKRGRDVAADRARTAGAGTAGSAV